MRSPVDDTLLKQTEQYRLCHCCERCVYFDPDSGACSEGYPNQEHRQRSLEGQAFVVFCKRFELA